MVIHNDSRLHVMDLDAVGSAIINARQPMFDSSIVRIFHSEQPNSMKFIIPD